MVSPPQAIRFSAPVFAQYPMHEVVPSAVIIAVAIDAISCATNLIVSFLLITQFLHFCIFTFKVWWGFRPSP